jgi:Domain of unknown function (DUF4281)
MPWEEIFRIANMWPLLFWIVLAFLPRTNFLAGVVMFGGITPLALCYTVLLPLIMTGTVDAVGPANAPPLDMTKLSGIMALFDSKGGATIGWIHYLAFDLLTGLWIGRNADRHGINRIIQIPILFFTLMAGPIGLLLYLLFRLTRKNPPEDAFAPS